MNTKHLIAFVALPGVYASALGFWCASVADSDPVIGVLTPLIAILSLLLMASMLNVTLAIKKMQERIDVLEKERAVTTSSVME